MKCGKNWPFLDEVGSTLLRWSMPSMRSQGPSTALSMSRTALRVVSYAVFAVALVLGLMRSDAGRSARPMARAAVAHAAIAAAHAQIVKAPVASARYRVLGEDGSDDDDGVTQQATCVRRGAGPVLFAPPRPTVALVAPERRIGPRLVVSRLALRDVPVPHDARGPPRV